MAPTSCDTSIVSPSEEAMPVCPVTSKKRSSLKRSAAGTISLPGHCQPSKFRNKIHRPNAKALVPLAIGHPQHSGPLTSSPAHQLSDDRSGVVGSAPLFHGTQQLKIPQFSETEERSTGNSSFLEDSSFDPFQGPFPSHDFQVASQNNAYSSPVPCAGGELTPDPSTLKKPLFPLPGECNDSPLPRKTDVIFGLGDGYDEVSLKVPSWGKLVPGTTVVLREKNGQMGGYDYASRESFLVKEYPIGTYRKALSPYFMLPYDLNFQQLVKIIEVPEESKVYGLFEVPEGGDLHAYIRRKKRLKEEEAKTLFKGIVKVVAECHENNILCRELKLRKCIFLDKAKTRLVLQGLEEGKVLEDGESDVIHDRHGCPAYVSPEVVASAGGYSGKAADSWSLGVVLYSMLIGKYPFQNDTSRSILQQVRRGEFNLPTWLSLQARCLIKSLLCMEPSRRLTPAQALTHNWFKERVRTTPRPMPDAFSRPSREVKVKAKDGGPAVPPMAPDAPCVLPDDYEVPQFEIPATFNGFL